MNMSKSSEVALENILLGVDAAHNLSIILTASQDFYAKAFVKIRSAPMDEAALESFCTAAISICLPSMITAEQLKPLMDCVIYKANSQFVKKNFDVLLALIERNSAKYLSDSIFLRGVVQYKCGNSFLAQREFQKLMVFKNNLQFHQTGAISYFHEWSPSASTAIEHPVIFHKMGVGSSSGVVLMSCDYGYFSAYFEQTIARLLCTTDILIHFHLVLPEGFCITKLDGFDHERIGMSYEYERTDAGANKKTYYSTVRYLVCPTIIRSYKKPVLVADIDIDFPKDFSSIFKKIQATEIALLFGMGGLPWRNVLAGFNLFGIQTDQSEFLTYLNQFLMYCHQTGRDGWMLDQVALDLAYRAKSGLGNIQDIENIKSFTVKQYKNRLAFRLKAQQALSVITNKK